MGRLPLFLGPILSTWGSVIVRQILLGCNGINNNMTLDIFMGSARVVIVS